MLLFHSFSVEGEALLELTLSESKRGPVLAIMAKAVRVAWIGVTGTEWLSWDQPEAGLGQPEVSYSRRRRPMASCTVSGSRDDNVAMDILFTSFSQSQEGWVETGPPKEQPRLNGALCP